MTITRFERPMSLAMHSTFRGGQYDYVADFEPTATGTLVRERVEMSLKGPMKLLEARLEAPR